MSPVSFEDDALPPRDAPLAKKLCAVMTRSTDYATARALGKALGMSDGSLVGKWLTGTIPSMRYRMDLDRLFGTPDYFSTPQVDRLEELAVKVDLLASEQETLLADLDDARTRIAQLEAERTTRRAGSTRPRKKPA